MLSLSKQSVFKKVECLQKKCHVELVETWQVQNPGMMVESVDTTDLT